MMAITEDAALIQNIVKDIVARFNADRRSY